MLLSQVTGGKSVKHVPRRHYSTHLLNPVAESGDVITHAYGMRLRYINLQNFSMIRKTATERHKESLPSPAGNLRSYGSRSEFHVVHLGTGKVLLESSLSRLHSD
jgi:hypothetical protein